MGVPDTDIMLGIGFRWLKFGASREEVRQILGEPDEKKMEDFLDDGSVVQESWLYLDTGLEATFRDDDEFRLGSLAVEGAEFVIEGESLIGRETADVLSFANSRRWGPHESDWLPNGEMITFSEVSVTLVIQNGTLESLDWGYFWIDDDTPRWPD